jgi:predicted ATP-grasp superfamily ATP-dependent carboligase
MVLVKKTRPDLIHPQHDFEVRAVSRFRSELEEQGVRLYLPDRATVENGVDKFKSYEIWKTRGVPVPETILVREPADLKRALQRFEGRMWIRATEGGGGAGSLPVEGEAQLEFARLWVDRFQGWNGFTASERLTPDSITFLSLWHRGELVVGQTRRRLKWNFANRTLSGVTGITGVASTCQDDRVTQTALDAVAALDASPHGIFCVDMTYDHQGRPRVTEMNIGRFFTTVHFFTRAGVNFPQIYRDIALENKFPALSKKINPLPDGLVWIRGMDREPLLTTLAELEALEKNKGLKSGPKKPAGG